MFWLKYKHGFASHTSAWEWMPVYYDTLEEAKREVQEEELSRLADEHNWSDKYRGITWEVVESAPLSVIKNHYESACRELDWAGRKKKMFEEELGKAKECPQCANAKTDDNHQYSPRRMADYDYSKRPRSCPTCGRENVFPDSMPYYLPPEHEVAFKLLKLLVTEGEQAKNPDWPAGYDKKKDGRPSPIQLLLDLGLIGGVCKAGSSKTVWSATDLGKREVARRNK